MPDVVRILLAPEDPAPLLKPVHTKGRRRRELPRLSIAPGPLEIDPAIPTWPRRHCAGGPTLSDIFSALVV